MVKIKDGDFVKVEFNVYSNGNLVQTTNEKLGKLENIKVAVYGPQTMIIGKAFILKALDDGLKKNSSGVLELTPEQAYGKRQKNMIKTFAKSSFEEQKLKPIVGMTYDFNGMYGNVKSIVGGRIMVDFNNPLAGKNIKIEYNFVEFVDNILEKIKVVLRIVLRLTNKMYEISIKEKDIILKVPKQILSVKEMLNKSLKEMITDIKNYNVKFEELVIKK